MCEKKSSEEVLRRSAGKVVEGGLKEIVTRVLRVVPKDVAREKFWKTRFARGVREKRT